MKNKVQKQYMLYDKIKEKLKVHLDADLRLLLNSSKNQDIAVLVGRTGSGKSTLMNFINDMELFVNDDDEIELMHPADPSAMKIGMGGKSETLIPKFVKVGPITFYDLPGLDDNRGTAINLVNASFIKRIVESAKSVRLIFVAGQDEITASRGESFKSLLQTMSILLPGTDAIQISSSLIITKSQKTNSHTLIDYLKGKIEDVDMMKNWYNPDRIQPMSKMIDLTQQNDIIRKIKNTTPQKINNVNIEAVYNAEVKNDLRQIFKLEMTSSLEKIHNLQPKNQQTVEEINIARLYFQDSFKNNVLSDLANSTIIELLKPLSEQIYTEELTKLSDKVKENMDLSISQLDLKNQKLVNLEQKKKAEEELAISESQKETLKKDKQRLEEDMRRQKIQAAERDRQQEIQMNQLRDACKKGEQDRTIQKAESDKKFNDLNKQMKKEEQERNEYKADQEAKSKQQSEENNKLVKQINNQQQELRRIQEENEQNKPENWPQEVQSRRDHAIYWDEKHYYGPWCDRKGFFNSGSKRKVFVNEIRVTLVSERSVGVKPITRQVYVIQDWEQVSRSEEPTGETKFIKWQKD